MTKDELILKWQKELEYSQQRSDEARQHQKQRDTDKWQQNVIIIRSILKDIKNLNGETVKRENVCFAHACGNNTNNKCKHGDYNCSGRISKHE